MPDVRMKYINLLQCEPGFYREEMLLASDYLLYVHSGKGIFKIGDISYEAAMGDLFYCPPLVGNTIIADLEDPFLLSGIEYVAVEYRDFMKYRYSLLSNRFLIEVVWEMIREFRYRKIGAENICDAGLRILLEKLKRMTQGEERSDTAKELLEYIADNLHRSITHEELTRVFNYHKNSINRFLIKETGLSLKNYLIELRIRKASELLKYSDKSIGEIGELCGYNSSVFFSRQFREKTGLTPMEFRRSYDRRNTEAYRRHLQEKYGDIPEVIEEGEEG